jgi:hypothetical protein
MNILIRDSQTGFFFVGPMTHAPMPRKDLHWTLDPVTAHDFRFIDQALDFIANAKLSRVELAFAFVTQTSMECIKSVPLERVEVDFHS